MNQTKKLVLAIVLLVAAAGLFAWHFMSNKQVKTEEPQEMLLNTKAAKALENIFSKVSGGKKWNDSSLWSTPGAAKKHAARAEKFFTAQPGMDKVKVLDYGTNRDNDDAPFVVIQVPSTQERIQVEFKPKSADDKSGELLMDNIILESEIRGSSAAAGDK
ncbi:MAG: hypothetical protein IKS83_05670 [Victivallales bacterium]|nr:hypothetical protein [Victivallales bacterium]